MKEILDLLDAYDLMEGEGGRGVLATIVATRGSTYRGAGARMLLLGDGRRIGTLSGGCLEREIVERASGVLGSGEITSFSYNAEASEEAILGLGLGCEGRVEIILEPVGGGRSAHLPFVARCLRGARAGVLATVFRSSAPGGPAVGERLELTDGQAAGELAAGGCRDRIAAAAADLLARHGRSARGRCSTVTCPVADAEAAVLLELLVPPVRLMLFGSGSDAPPLARIGRDLGWSVTVVDPRPAGRTVPATGVVACEPRNAASLLGSSERVAAVVMSHDYLTDLEVARALLPSSVPYLGFVGPRKRGERLLADLKRQGIEASEERLRAFHSPAGLDIGADSPEEIAVSIVSEIMATLTGRTGGRLRDRSGPIHHRSR